MKNGKNLVSACVVERIQINCCMILIKAWLLILHQGAEHGLCMTSEVMTVNGDILAWGLKIRSFQRKQRSQITFLPGERMVEIVIGIIRLDHRVIDRGVRDLQPADEIRVYLLTGGKVRKRVPGFRSRTRGRQWNKRLLSILGNCRGKA